MTPAKSSKKASKSASARTAVTSVKRKQTKVKGSAAGKKTRVSATAVKKAGKKSAAKKVTAKKTSAGKSAAKKSAANKTAARRPAPKKPPGKKTTAKKTIPKKPAARKITGKAAAKKGTTGKPKPKRPSGKITTGKPVPKKTTARKTKAEKPSAKKPAIKKETKVVAKKPSIRKTAPSAKPTAKPRQSSGHKTPLTRVPFNAYKGMKPYIYISYSHRNMREVFNIIKKLNQSRYRIWYDEGIEPGFEWPEVVGRAIVGASLLVVFMSRFATKSRNVRNEINLAFAENKDILVVYLENTNLSAGMKLQIGTVQHINRFDMTEREFMDKLRTVLSSDLRN